MRKRKTAFDGGRMLAIMGEQGKTYKAVAAFVGVNENTIGNYINGHTVPDADKVAKISKLLKVSSDYLLGLKDERR